VAEAAQTLTRLIEPSGAGTPLEQLTASLDAYLAWIAANAPAWRKLMQSAAALPEARELVEGFRAGSVTSTPPSWTGLRTRISRSRPCAICSWPRSARRCSPPSRPTPS
jgi:hypothetical protein